MKMSVSRKLARKRERQERYWYVAHGLKTSAYMAGLFHQYRYHIEIRDKVFDSDPTGGARQRGLYDAY